MNKKNGFLILILVGLVVAAEFVEKDFMCPCEEALRWAFFFLYLLIPAVITFTVTYCIMCELYKQDFASERSDVENESSEERRRQKAEADAEGPRKCRFIMKCFIPTAVWIILFFSDGRFVACLCTELKGGYADSNPHPPWEWCHKSRNLTDAQQRAETSHKYSKVAGFGCLFFVSTIILIYKCVIIHKPSNQQTQEQTAVECEVIPLQ